MATLHILTITGDPVDDHIVTVHTTREDAEDALTEQYRDVAARYVDWDAIVASLARWDKITVNITAVDLLDDQLAELNDPNQEA